jgi:cell division protein FtsB
MIEIPANQAQIKALSVRCKKLEDQVRKLQKGFIAVVKRLEEEE